MPDPKHLRELAARMFALSRATHDQELAQHLALRASDYIDRAIELEKAAAQRPRTDEPEKP